MELIGADVVLDHDEVYLETMPMKSRDFIEKAVDKGKELVSNNVIQRVQYPRSVLTGIFGEVSNAGDEGRFGIRHDAIYFLEHGSTAHEIVPIMKNALKIELPSGTIFTKKVDHPGYEGKKLITDAGNDLQGFIDELLEESFLLGERQ